MTRQTCKVARAPVGEAVSAGDTARTVPPVRESIEPGHLGSRKGSDFVTVGADLENNGEDSMDAVVVYKGPPGRAATPAS